MNRTLGRRLLAATTTLALAAGAVVVLAPSASAYYGRESLVRNAVLSADRVAAASYWDTTAHPVTDHVTRVGLMAFDNTILGVVLDERAPVPESVGLVVRADQPGRDAYFATWRKQLRAAAVHTQSSATGILLTDQILPAHDAVPALYESIAIRYSGSDGIALGSCLTPVGTLGTVSERFGCANDIAFAQDSHWRSISPSNAWKSESLVQGHLIKAWEAHDAAHLPPKATTRIARRYHAKADWAGRTTGRNFQTTAPKRMLERKLSYPAHAAVTDFGNRLNADVALAKWRAGDDRAKHLYAQSRDGYTLMFKRKVRGGKAHYSYTVLRFSDVLITTTCVSRPGHHPRRAALRRCSQRLAAADLAHARTLYLRVR